MRKTLSQLVPVYAALLIAVVVVVILGCNGAAARSETPSPPRITKAGNVLVVELATIDDQIPSRSVIPTAREIAIQCPSSAVGSVTSLVAPGRSGRTTHLIITCQTK